MNLTTTQARRIALAAQGFTRPRPGLDGEVASRHVNRIIERLGFFQIDSVNVLARAHYMPLFSRLGPYDRELLHRAASRRPRRLFEYWAHEAALVDVKLWQAFQFRMDSGAAHVGQHGADHPGQARVRRLGAGGGARQGPVDRSRGRARRAA